MNMPTNLSSSCIPALFLSARPRLFLSTLISFDMYVYRGKITWSDKFLDEGVTILFPTSMASGDQVYLFSQWSMIPDGVDGKAFVGGGVVVASDGTSENITLSFHMPGGAVNLSATRSDNKLLLRLGGGAIVKDLASLSLVYHESDIHVRNQRVYTGKLDFKVSVGGKTHKAIDETLFVITTHDISGTERLLCAFWQWTEAHIARKVNANFISPTNSTTTQLIEGEFTLVLEQDEEEQEQQVLLMEWADVTEEMQKFEVVLASLADAIKVTNDLDTFVQCNVEAKLSSTVSNIFTWVGMGFAVTGIPLAIALPPAGGVAFALAGFAAATAGTVWSYMTPDGQKYPAMPPGAILESSVIIGSFDVFVMRILQSGTTLAVQSAFMADQTGTFNLSTIGDTDWKDIIRLDSILGTKTLTTRAFFTFKDLSAVPSGSEVTNENGNNNYGIYALSEEKEPRYNGLIKTQDETPIDLFTKNAGSSVAVLFAALSYGTTVRIYRLTNGQLAVRFRSYTLTGYSPSDVVEIPADDVPGMLYNIAHDAEGRLAYFTTNDDKFMAVSNTASAWTVQYRYPAVTTMVFLRVAVSPVINCVAS